MRSKSGLVSAVLLAGLFASHPTTGQTVQSLTLAWNASTSSSVTGYRVHYGNTSGSYPYASDVGNTTTATIAGLQAGQQYFFVATARDAAGNESPPSNEISYQTPGGVAAPLPAPWQTRDIGGVVPAGSASQSNGLFTVSGAGLLSGSSDRFRIVFQNLSADGEIIAHLDSVGSVNTAGRTGLMIRESLAADSEYALVGLSQGARPRWQYRGQTAGSTSSSQSRWRSVPNWLRLTRTGTRFTGYQSDDGTNWSQVGSTRISMASQIYIGLVVSSGDTNQLSTSRFSRLSVIP